MVVRTRSDECKLNHKVRGRPIPDGNVVRRDTNANKAFHASGRQRRF